MAEEHRGPDRGLRQPIENRRTAATADFGAPSVGRREAIEKDFGAVAAPPFEHAQNGGVGLGRTANDHRNIAPYGDSRFAARRLRLAYEGAVQRQQIDVYQRGVEARSCRRRSAVQRVENTPRIFIAAAVKQHARPVVGMDKLREPSTSDAMNGMPLSRHS